MMLWPQARTLFRPYWVLMLSALCQFLISSLTKSQFMQIATMFDDVTMSLFGNRRKLSQIACPQMNTARPNVLVIDNL